MSEAPLGGLAFADLWSIDFHAGFIFEVDTSRAELLIPEDLELVETAPSLSLMSVIHAHYLPGNLGTLPVFDEVVCSLLVHPDLSMEMPTPRLSFHVLDVWSNSKGFVDYKTGALGMPVHYHPTLRCSIADDRLSTRVWDDEGPMFELGLGEVTPKFGDHSFYGQYFAQPSDTLNHGPWKWTGRLTEHQRPREVHTKLHPHSFFAEGLLGGNPPRCNLQQLSEPGATVNVTTYEYRVL